MHGVGITLTVKYFNFKLRLFKTLVWLASRLRIFTKLLIWLLKKQQTPGICLKSLAYYKIRFMNARRMDTEYERSAIAKRKKLLKSNQALTLLSPDIKMHILITDLHTFLMELVRRICLNIKTSHPQ